MADEASKPEAAAPVLKVPAKRPAPPKQEQISEPIAMTAANPPPPQAGRRRSRWRLVKIGLAAAASLVLLAGVAAIIAVSNIDPRDYAGLVTTSVEEATGRKLEINGDIDIALSLTPGVVIEDITLSNATWSQQPLMASAQRLEVEIRLLPLLVRRCEDPAHRSDRRPGQSGTRCRRQGQLDVRHGRGTGRGSAGE